MLRNSLSGLHPYSKIIFSLFIVLACFLAIFLIALLIAMPVFNISVSELSNYMSDYKNPDNVVFLKYLQTVQSVGLFIVPAFIIGYFMNQNTYVFLGFNVKISTQRAMAAVIIMLVALPLVNYLGLINSTMQLPEWLSGFEQWMKEKEAGAQELTRAFLVMENQGQLIFNIFMIGLLPAIGEELIFRGIFQQIFTDWTKNIHWGIFIAAFLFSTMHFQFYGFLPRLLLGMLFGYLFYWSRSIWIPMLVHFVNNTTAVFAYYFYPEKINQEVESFESVPGLEIFLIFNAAIFALLLYRFYRKSNVTH